MSEPIRCSVGDWVEVSYVLLEPADRATGLPADTAAQPLVAWVKGYALGAGVLGEELTIETPSGRTVTGTLTEVSPGYSHSFGRPPAEIASIGREVRARVAAYRAGVGE